MGDLRAEILAFLPRDLRRIDELFGLAQTCGRSLMTIALNAVKSDCN